MFVFIAHFINRHTLSSINSWPSVANSIEINVVILWNNAEERDLKIDKQQQQINNENYLNGKECLANSRMTKGKRVLSSEQ